MHDPMFVRELAGEERRALEAGLKGRDGFRLRRCQVLLASARGGHAPALGEAQRERLREVLHQSPRLFGKPRSTWTLALAADDPGGPTDPKALACYGLFRRDTGDMMLRFVAGRPVGHVTTRFPSAACGDLAAEGKSLSGKFAPTLVALPDTDVGR